MLAKYISVVVFSRAIRRKNTADLLNCVTHNKSASQCHALVLPSERFDFLKEKGVKTTGAFMDTHFSSLGASVKAEMGHKAIK